MTGHDIIVVGASAGGVELLVKLVSALPANLPAAVFVVLHIPAQNPSILPKILNRAINKQQADVALQAVHPDDGDRIELGKIYIAPPDQHLLVKNGYIRLARGPRENNHRPAVDPLFRTAARAYGQRVVALILSGSLDDGTAGLLAVKQCGGVAVVQHPEDALYPGMPRSAIENVQVDYILPAAEIAALLVELADQPIEPTGVEVMSSDRHIDIEADMAELEPAAVQQMERPGKPSVFGCPDCGGVLWELQDEDVVRFRCRTGHAYSVGALLAQQTEAQEEALWNALRALEEKATLSERLAKRAGDRQQHISARRFSEQAQAARQRAELVRQLLLKDDGKINLSTVNGQLIETSGNQVAAENSELDLLAKYSMPLQPPPTGAIPPSFPLVAICASAGGLKALSQVLSALPADFPAAITVVQHISPQYPSLMAEILDRQTDLAVKPAATGDVLRPGRVFVAPPDQHLLVNPDLTLSLSHSALVHFVRPSADLLFESAASSFQQQAIAVVLTGTGSDGTMGVQAIKQMGGTVIVQSEETSEYTGMPLAAINTGAVDQIVPLSEIASALLQLVTSKGEELQQS